MLPMDRMRYRDRKRVDVVLVSLLFAFRHLTRPFGYRRSPAQFSDASQRGMHRGAMPPISNQPFSLQDWAQQRGALKSAVCYTSLMLSMEGFSSIQH